MTERQTAWLLIVLLVGQLILVASQVTAGNSQRSQLAAFGLRLTAPVARAAHSGADSVRDLRNRFHGRRGLLSENEQLRQEVEDLRLELTRLHGLDEEAQRLAAALDFSRQQPGNLRVAEIAYLDTTSWLRNMLIYAGRSDLEVNQPVLAADGLVGRIVLVTGPYAQVQLLTDAAASVSAMVERTRRQALVQGTNSGGLEMIYMPLQADVQVGDLVATAGIDGVFPRGIPVGTVTSVEPGDELFHRIQLKPAVNLDRLGQVYTLDRPTLPQSLTEPPLTELPRLASP